MNPSDRSYLFVPGNRPERFNKAIAAGADAVIIDLEDSVLPEFKATARSLVAQWLDSAVTQVFLRINPRATPWYEGECKLSNSQSVRGVMLPKSEDPEYIRQFTRGLKAGTQLVPLIETVRGYFAIPEIATIPGVTRLAFGSFDFMVDAGIRRPESLDLVRINLVLESRRAGLIPPIDGVSLSINDAAKLEQEVRYARQLGFSAKLCIHPSQVAPLHAGFAPSEDELAWARRVIAAVDKGSLGAIAVDGKLVDKPILTRARTLLQESSR